MIPREAFWRAALHNPARNFILGWIVMAVILFIVGYLIMTTPNEIPFKALLNDST